MMSSLEEKAKDGFMLPPLINFGYHRDYHTDQVRISDDGNVATKLDPEVIYAKGAVYSECPVTGDCEFEVEITSYGTSWSGSLKLGLMLHESDKELDPTKIPRYTPESPDHWVWSVNKFHNHITAKNEVYGKRTLDELREGDRVGLQITAKGTVQFFINGKPQGIATRSIYRPGYDVYLVVDHYANCKATRITRAVMEENVQEHVRQLEERLQQCQTEHSKAMEQNSQLQEHNRQLEERLQQSQTEVTTLRARLTSMEQMEQSWKVSHKDVTLSKEELGRGGWGVIWVGEFRGQKVAVKQIHELIASPEYLELLHREINIMAQLRHPNLLQFIGAVFDHPSGHPMIITEVMDTSLRRAYENKLLVPTPACQPVILSIMRDVAVGLNYLHCLPEPIIHRDVSSANVLLESKGEGKWKTKVSDFGSAKLAQSAVTKAPGAEVYSAPECLQSITQFDDKKKQTPKLDVFSYGILLCEVITCRFPTRQYFKEMLEQVRTRAPSLHSLIVSCVKDKPEERPTMQQVIKQLDTVK